MAGRRGGQAELLANGDLLVAEGGHRRRVTKATDDHRRLMRSAVAGELELERAAGRFGGPQSPPRPSAADVLARLDVADASPTEQKEVVSRSAYGGALRPGELDVMRRAGLIPYDFEATADATGE